MSVADTSLDALRKKIREGTDVSDRERCRAIIEVYGPITSEEMELHMGKSKHAFTGRIRKLKDLGEIEVVGRRDGHQLLDAVDESVDGVESESIDGVGEVYVPSDEPGSESVTDKSRDELEAGDVILE